MQSAPDGFWIIDQQSTNGTLLNGKPIEKALLHSGDVIELGRHGPQIQMSLESAPSTAQQPKPGSGLTLRQTFSQIGVYNPEKEKQANHLKTALALLAAGVMVCLVSLIFLSTLGFVGALIGAVMAFLPAPFYLFILLWMDRYDPEPPWALAGAFAWGALFAIVVSFIVNTIFGSVVATIAGESAGLTLSAILSAPFIEELTKGLGVVLIYLLLRREFDGVLDGIVYAGVIGLGFATVENVLYYGRAFVQSGARALLLTGLLRGVLSPFIHSFFTSMTGIGCGIARESHKRGVQFLLPLLGFFGAVILHLLWNVSAALMGGFFFVAYFVVWVPLFLFFLGMIFLMALRESRIIRRSLAFEVGTLLTDQELKLAGSLRERIRWLLAAVNDWKKLQARRRFLTAVTKLAFCYWHVESATMANQETISAQQIPRFRSEITALKPAI